LRKSCLITLYAYVFLPTGQERRIHEEPETRSRIDVLQVVPPHLDWKELGVRTQT
jgi:hypothetical protein